MSKLNKYLTYQYTVKLKINPFLYFMGSKIDPLKYETIYLSVLKIPITKDPFNTQLYHILNKY